jgi:hypothetical protein
VRLAFQLPDSRFSRLPDQCLQARRSYFSQTGPFARNGLSLASKGLRLRGFHSRVNGPGLLLRSLACRSFLPVRLSAPPPVAGLPQRPAASTPQARFILSRLALPAVPPAFAPRLEFSLHPDQSVNGLRNRSVRLPKLPDLRSLPAAFPCEIRLRIIVPAREEKQVPKHK